MLISVEHEILNAHMYKNIKEFGCFLGSDKPDMLFFLLINVKMPTTVGIFIFMSRKNFMLSWVEHEKNFFITSGQGVPWPFLVSLHKCTGSTIALAPSIGIGKILKFCVKAFLEFIRKTQVPGKTKYSGTQNTAPPSPLGGTFKTFKNLYKPLYSG